MPKESQEHTTEIVVIEIKAGCVVAIYGAAPVEVQVRDVDLGTCESWTARPLGEMPEFKGERR